MSVSRLLYPDLSVDRLRGQGTRPLTFSRNQSTANEVNFISNKDYRSSRYVVATPKSLQNLFGYAYRSPIDRSLSRRHSMHVIRTTICRLLAAKERKSHDIVLQRITSNRPKSIGLHANTREQLANEPRSLSNYHTCFIVLLHIVVLIYGFD